MHGRDLHRLVDARRRNVERPAEHEREHEHVVDLVRVVGASRRDDRVRARFLGERGHDLRLGIREREDQRIGRHARQPFGLEHLRCGQAEEHVRAGQHFGERARLRRLRVARLVLVHELLAALVDDARDVGHPDVLDGNAEAHEQIEARERRSAGTGCDQLDLRQVLPDHAQAIEDRRADDDRGAVLVVVEDGDAQALAQLALHVEALRRLDVLEVDAAERGLERGDDFDEAVGIKLVDLDVEAVDPRELLEQHRLAFHHRLRRERPDGPETEHRRAVGDHADQVAPSGEIPRFRGIAHDLVADSGNPRRIRKREVALVDELLGGDHRDLARRRLAVVLEGGFADIAVGHAQGSRTRNRAGVDDSKGFCPVGENVSRAVTLPVTPP